MCVLILEAEPSARRRGAKMHGRVLGYASTSNAYHMTGLPAEGEALASAVNIALARARIEPDQVDYINAHGSSTQQNDRGETAAYKKAFGNRAYRIPISSTKSCIGHALGAASAIESVVCLMALARNTVPSTLNYELHARIAISITCQMSRATRVSGSFRTAPVATLEFIRPQSSEPR